MTVKQLSVFIENRQGRLGEVLAVLKHAHVNILSMCVADTTEYGLLRLIVNDPEKGKDALLAEGFSSMVTDVIIIKVRSLNILFSSSVRIGLDGVLAVSCAVCIGDGKSLFLVVLVLPGSGGGQAFQKRQRTFAAHSAQG